jgi:hypothetical protein
MESKLSLKIAKYYQKDKNKIVFTNGMSLNKMAWEMWERLGCREVDPSVVSRVLNGERLFTKKQLKCFTAILKIRETEKEELEFVLDQLIGERLGIDFSKFEQGYYVDLISNNLEKIQQVRISGNPLLTLNWAATVLSNVDEKTSFVKNKYLQNKILNIKGMILKEKMRALLEITPEGEENNIREVATQLKEVGQKVKNQYLYSLAFYMYGELLIRKKKYVLGARNLHKFIDKVGIHSGSEEVLLSLRKIAQSNANMGRESEYKKISGTILKIKDNYSSEFAPVVAYGLAECELALGINNYGLNSLESAWNSYDKYYSIEERLKNLRKIQIIRTELSIAAKYKKIRSARNLENISKEAIAISKFAGYERYANQMSDLLKEVFI